VLVGEALKLGHAALSVEYGKSGEAADRIAAGFNESNEPTSRSNLTGQQATYHMKQVVKAVKTELSEQPSEYRETWLAEQVDTVAGAYQYYQEMLEAKEQKKDGSLANKAAIEERLRQDADSVKRATTFFNDEAATVTADVGGGIQELSGKRGRGRTRMFDDEAPDREVTKVMEEAAARDTAAREHSAVLQRELQADRLKHETNLANASALNDRAIAKMHMDAADRRDAAAQQLQLQLHTMNQQMQMQLASQQQQQQLSLAAMQAGQPLVQPGLLQPRPQPANPLPSKSPDD
jgi:hypothetical protein